MSRMTTDAQAPLRLGERVLIRWPGTVLEAEVIADRGFILTDGGQVVRIRAVAETDLPSEYDIPAEYLERVAEPRAA
jgi:hypothetical protein